MGPCTFCKTPGADLFTPHGDLVCQPCDSRFRAEALQQQADRQVAMDPIGAGLTFASPRTLRLAGAALIAGSLVLGLLEALVLGRVHLLLIGMVFMAGVAALYRSF
jgi:hypothetical protein